MAPRFLLVVLLVAAAVLDQTLYSVDAAAAAPAAAAPAAAAPAAAAPAAVAPGKKAILDGDKQKKPAGTEAGGTALKATIKPGTKYSIEVYLKKDNAHAFAKITGGAGADAIELWVDDKIEKNPLLSYIMLRKPEALPAVYAKGGFVKVGNAMGNLDGQDILNALEYLPGARYGMAYDLQTNYCGYIITELLAIAGAREKDAMDLIFTMVDSQVAIKDWGDKWEKQFTKAGVPAAVKVLKDNLQAAFSKVMKKDAAVAAPAAAAKKFRQRLLAGLQPKVL